MKETTAVILAAGIGALAGLGGALVTAILQARLERTKWQRKEDDEQRDKFEAAVQQFATKVAAAGHSICWLTWIAKENPSRLTQETIDNYDKEIHKLLPEISGLRATLEYLNPASDGEATKLAKELYALDVKVAKAGLTYSDDPQSAVASLADLHTESGVFEGAIPKASASIIATYPIPNT